MREECTVKSSIDAKRALHRAMDRHDKGSKVKVYARVEMECSGS